MPLPSRRSGESKKDFIGRCMANDNMRREFPKRKQRYAVCQSRATKSTKSTKSSKAGKK